MILHEYAILPFEIGKKSSKRASKKAQKMGWSCSDTPGTTSYPSFFRSPDPINLPHETEYHMDLIFIDTSACFLFHRITCQPPQVKDNMAKDILVERNLLNKHLLSNEEDPFLAEVLEQLGVMKWQQTKASYVFNFCVLEMDRTPTKKSLKNLKIISDRSIVGIYGKMTACNIKQLNFESMNLTRLQEIKDIDPYPHTNIYATWSSVVAITWGDKQNADATKQMLVKMELGLQSIWNHSYQLNISATALKDKRKRSDKRDLLLTATRFLEKYKRRNLPSSTSSTREVDILNQLVATSRIDKQIDALESSLLKEYDYRRERGQGWIRVFLVLLITIGATQAIFDLTMLKGWKQYWCVLVLWIGAGYSTYWLTVRRTKQGRRK